MAVAFALALGGGCYTLRMSAGPNRRSNGDRGLAVTTGLGMGIGFEGPHALYVTPSVGVLADEGAWHPFAFQTIDYVYAGWRHPMRVGERVGVVFEPTDVPGANRELFGVTAAWFPWTRCLLWDESDGGFVTCHGEGAAHEGEPYFAGISAFGLELAVDALPISPRNDGSAETNLMVTLSLVMQEDALMDRRHGGF